MLNLILILLIHITDTQLEAIYKKKNFGSIVLGTESGSVLSVHQNFVHREEKSGT